MWSTLRAWIRPKTFKSSDLACRVRASEHCITVTADLPGRMRVGRLVAQRKEALPDMSWVARLPRLDKLPIVVVSDMKVDPRFRRRGIGRAIANALLAEVSRTGEESLILGWVKTPVARQFWQSIGLSICGDAMYGKTSELINRHAPEKGLTQRKRG